MNYVDQQLGEKINHVLQNGGSKWNNTTAYLVGNVVQHSNAVWLCLVNNTNSTPTDVNVNWSKLLTLSTLPAYPTLNSLLPSQTGNSGKVLTTDGSNASWGANTGAFAFANWDATVASDITGTYTRTGTLVTANVTAHGHITGHRAWVDFTTGGALDGLYDVTRVDANTFTFNTVASGAIATSNLTLRRWTLRKALNVQSVGYDPSFVSNMFVNFSTLAPDANYIITDMVRNNLNDNTARVANYQATGSLKVTSGFGIRVVDLSSSAQASPEVCIAIFT
jgi:hypothetical protein